jgi:hypothetical protein
MATKNPRRPVLIAGIALIAIGAALFIASLALASSRVRVLSPWLGLAGVLLVLVWFVLDRLAVPPAKPKKPESLLFGPSTTRMDDSNE